jgi:hypothetical protein
MRIFDVVSINGVEDKVEVQGKDRAERKREARKHERMFCICDVF